MTVWANNPEGTGFANYFKDNKNMNNNTIKSETAPDYVAKDPAGTPNDDDLVISTALAILDRRIKKNPVYITSADDSIDFLRLKLAGLECEVFGCLFLNTRHRVIEYQELARGTINGATVHVREIVKATLAAGAASVIFAHNHPSGDTSPSNADKQLTERLKKALELIDVKVLDHIIIGDTALSFANEGLL